MNLRGKLHKMEEIYRPTQVHMLNSTDHKFIILINSILTFISMMIASKSLKANKVLIFQN